jgi:hypothetical protein
MTGVKTATVGGMAIVLAMNARITGPAITETAVIDGTMSDEATGTIEGEMNPEGISVDRLLPEVASAVHLADLVVLEICE